MMGLVLGVGLTLIQASNISSPGTPWSCAYVAERLPRSLKLLGDDALPAEETRVVRKQLSLSEAVLTRASGLALARAAGASRLVVIRCLDHKNATTIEAQTFDTSGPVAGSVFRIRESFSSLPAAIDRIARDLGPAGSVLAEGTFPAPSARALAKAGPALVRENAAERAAGLRAAVSEDPASIDLRLSAVEAFIAARDFGAAIELAGSDRGSAKHPAPLARRLRFLAAAARLEAGRYAEARDALDQLRQEEETAAVLNNLGVARFRLRDLEASGAFERALFFDDHRRLDISFNRSLALLFENKAAIALPALDAALAEDPYDTRARLLRVWALKFLARDDERAAEWDRLLARAPSFSPLAAPDLGRKLERIFSFERTP